MGNNKLNLSKMKHENVVVHCDTEDKAIKLLTALKEDGYVWHNSWEGLNQDLLEEIKYHKYHKRTCYRISDLIEKKISYSCYEFYQTYNFKIIPFDDLLEAPKYLTTEEIDALLDIAEQGEQEEVETVSKEEIITQLSVKKYLVSVVGGEAPKYIHNSLESAEKEAKRLASLEIGKEVMVLEYIKSYQAKVIVDEEIVETDNSKALKQKDKEIKALKKELADKINELNMTRSTFQKKLNKLKPNKK